MAKLQGGLEAVASQAPGRLGIGTSVCRSGELRLRETGYLLCTFHHAFEKGVDKSDHVTYAVKSMFLMLL